jgi:Xaa-Pro aminopeptidase
MDIKAIQTYLQECRLDGWLMADFHGRNDIAISFLRIDAMLTRRAFYFIPAAGKPTALVNKVEKIYFEDLDGNLIAYSGYKKLEEELAKLLDGASRVAMEYSPAGRLPYIGLVDAGTIELVRSFGVEVVSSADLVGNFQARLDSDQIASHRTAVSNVLEIKDRAFEYIKEALEEDRKVTEYDVVQFIMQQFENFEMAPDHAPICAVDGNAGNPHYEPTPERTAAIKKNQLILIDLWGALKKPRAVVADITWMAFSGTADQIPNRYAKVFNVLHEARLAAVEFAKATFGNNPLYGADIDNACRQVVVEAGYGDYFVHRTGHSITTNTHGSGPNIDDLETEDRRELKPGHLFSVEPGIYMDDCGFRTEIDVLITENGPEITTLPLQTEIRPLF